MTAGKRSRTQADCRGDNITPLAGPHPRTLYTLGVGTHLACGTESIDPGSEVPMHAHADQEEVLFCTGGTGQLWFGDRIEPEAFTVGVMVLVPRAVRHRIANLSGTDPLTLTWTLSPPSEPMEFKAAD